MSLKQEVPQCCGGTGRQPNPPAPSRLCQIFLFMGEKGIKKPKEKRARTFTAPNWVCLAIFLMSAMSFFSWLCRLFLSRSSSRMDLSNIRLFSLREVCEAKGLERATR